MQCLKIDLPIPIWSVPTKLWAKVRKYRDFFCEAKVFRRDIRAYAFCETVGKLMRIRNIVHHREQSLRNFQLASSWLSKMSWSCCTVDNIAIASPNSARISFNSKSYPPQHHGESAGNSTSSKAISLPRPSPLHTGARNTFTRSAQIVFVLRTQCKRSVISLIYERRFFRRTFRNRLISFVLTIIYIFLLQINTDSRRMSRWKNGKHLLIYEVRYFLCKSRIRFLRILHWART